MVIRATRDQFLPVKSAHMLLWAHATCQALPVNIDINSNSLAGGGPGGRTHISSFSPGKCDRSEGQMF